MTHDEERLLHRAIELAAMAPAGGNPLAKLGACAQLVLLAYESGLVKPA
jgi:hypothetical protein